MTNSSRLNFILDTTNPIQVMLWTLSSSVADPVKTALEIPGKPEPSLSPQPPLRKIMSRSTLAQLSAAVDIPSPPVTPTRRSPTRQPLTLSGQSISRSPPKQAAVVEEKLQHSPRPKWPLPLRTRGQVNVVVEDRPGGKSRFFDGSLEGLLSGLPKIRKWLGTNVAGPDLNILHQLRNELQLTLNATDNQIMATQASEP